MQALIRNEDYTKRYDVLTHEFNDNLKSSAYFKEEFFLANNFLIYNL